jgi:hypothetical protein
VDGVVEPHGNQWGDVWSTVGADGRDPRQLRCLQDAPRGIPAGSLKGLDKMAIFEVVDLGERVLAEMDEMHGPGLMAAIEREFNHEMHDRRAAAGC